MATNFAGQLVSRLGKLSYLIDAATGETVAPSDLPRFISSFGASLLSAGLKPGDPIVIGCVSSPASSIAYLGAMYAGLVPVPVEESKLPSSGNVLLNQTRAKALWTEKRSTFDWKCPEGFKFIDGHPSETKADPIPPVPREENDLVALVATSGSSDVPRFVMVSHGNLIANTEAIIRSQHLENDERAMLILPVSYCFGASVLQTHLYRGGGVVFDRRFMFPNKVLHAVNRYECTTFAGVPTVYNILLRRSNLRSIALPGLRRFLQAGGPLAPQHVQEMRAIVPTAKFYVMYGQTEATSRISCLDPESLDQKLGSVGQKLDNLAVQILDAEGENVPPGQSGEIVVRGPSVTLGYLDELEASRRVFKDGWLHTGDLGRLDEDGYIWIEGRKSAFLKVRGVRVNFAEVEARVAAVPGVYECAASAVAHPEAGEALVLYIVPDKTADRVADRVRRILPVHWTCDSIRIVSELPKTSSGKVSREALARKDSQAS
ncbi:MAG: class I adenylate-forming enzyme family protein [Candidatus Korobacteraceae bacterium]|jgi:acyl-CoA synthetase (AMP-forming)/AMP-acid ligase II